MNNSLSDDVIEGEVMTPKSKVVKSSKKTEPTFKQRKFAENYKDGETMGNGYRSALKAGYSEVSAASQASTLLKNPKVLTILNDSVELAESTIKSLILTGESDAIKLAASREVLDRTIGKPLQRSITGHVNISVEDMLNQ